MKTSLLLFLTLVALSGSLADRTLSCYWGTWANYRPGVGRFQVEDINPDLCDTLLYSFFGLNDKGEIILLDSWLDEGLEFISKAVALKKDHPKLKVIAAIGGWNAGSTIFSTMAADPVKRATFVNSVVQFLSKYGFDGLDVDWEYPAQRGGIPEDKQNFVTLLKELKKAFNPYKWQLSAAVAAAEQSASISYDIPAISKYLDYIYVMTYDFGGAWDPITTFNAPLKGNKTEFSVSASVNYWLKSGAPAKKLIMGIPLYGRTFTLANAAQNTPGSPAIGAGVAGPFTQEGGVLSYQEICTTIDSKSVIWNGRYQVPYAVNGNQWITFDNVKSVSKKVAYAKSKGLGGVMVWSIESDDFNGQCGAPYPLLSAIKKKLN